jgi:hypothetical protein
MADPLACRRGMEADQKDASDAWTDYVVYFLFRTEKE